jgi:acylphosphatase
MCSEVTNAIVALTGLIRGRVQGVFFLAETQARARKLGLKGWVKNTREGDVAVLLAGPEEAVRSMQNWLKISPPLARVDSVELTECVPPECSGFEIRY